VLDINATKPFVESLDIEKLKNVFPDICSLAESIQKIVNSNMTPEEANNYYEQIPMISHRSFGHKTIIDKNRFKTMHRESSKRMLKQTSTPYLANPMEPYHPNSPRSRLPEPDFVQPYRNSSTINIGSSGFNYFQSVQQTCFKNPGKLYKFTSNEDINSRNNKISKKNLYERFWFKNEWIKFNWFKSFER